MECFDEGGGGCNLASASVRKLGEFLFFFGKYELEKQFGMLRKGNNMMPCDCCGSQEWVVMRCWWVQMPEGTILFKAVVIASRSASSLRMKMMVSSPAMVPKMPCMGLLSML